MRRGLEAAKAWARNIKRDVLAVWLAARDPRTPLAARILALCVAAYALSPIDLIPDFIPVLGYLDDLLIVPLGILAVLRLVPDHLILEYRGAASALAERPVSRAGAAIIVVVWLAMAIAAWTWLTSAF